MLNSLFSLRQFPRLEPAGERERLVAQRGLHVGEELRRLGGLLLGRLLVALLLEGRGNDFLFAPGDLAGIAALAAAAASATAAAGLLGLGELPLERIDLDEHHVRVRFRRASFAVA